MDQDVVVSLTALGWTVECESPLEIRHTDGSFLRESTARLFIMDVMNSIDCQDDNERIVEIQSDGNQKFNAAKEALSCVLGDMADVSRNKGPRWTKEQRKKRAEFEQKMCEFLTERSQKIQKPERKFKLTDSEVFAFAKLDAISDDGYCIADFRECSFVFDDFDDLRYRGAAITEWKLLCAQIACGMPGPYKDKFPRMHAFQAAWFLYCDVNANVYMLPLNRFEKIKNLLSTRAYDPEYPLLTRDRFENGDDMCWYVPTVYWTHLGNLLATGDMRFCSLRPSVEV